MRKSAFICVAATLLAGVAPAWPGNSEWRLMGNGAEQQSYSPLRQI